MAQALASDQGLVLQAWGLQSSGGYWDFVALVRGIFPRLGLAEARQVASEYWPNITGIRDTIQSPDAPWSVIRQLPIDPSQPDAYRYRVKLVYDRGGPNERWIPVPVDSEVLLSDEQLTALALANAATLIDVMAYVGCALESQDPANWSVEIDGLTRGS